MYTQSYVLDVLSDEDRLRLAAPLGTGSSWTAVGAGGLRDRGPGDKGLETGAGELGGGGSGTMK
jgi:hypothetical protein